LSTRMQKPALFLSAEAPYPMHGGGAIRSASLLHYLARGREVDLIVFRQPGDPDPRAALPAGLVRRAAVIELPATGRGDLMRAFRTASRLARDVPPLTDRFSGFEKEIEQAIGVSRQMYLAAMAAAKPGKYEYEVVSEIIRVAKANGRDLSFPIICSVHGETLHNHHHANLMQKGDVMVLDSGVETPDKYASDITRTIPVGGTFTSQQRQIYEMVLRAQLAAIKAITPGVRYRDVHLLAARSFAADLKAVGLMKGDIGEAVAAGAHAMFFPHGLGHMIGLDVHDLENIGEQYVGYEPGVERSTQFGLGYLRLGYRDTHILLIDGLNGIGSRLNHSLWEAFCHADRQNYQ